MMRTIHYFDSDLTVEEYVKKEILKNAGTQNVAMKSDLEHMCETLEIDFHKNSTKEELLTLLLENGCSYESLASSFSIGVSSQVYQNAFNITHQDIKRLEKCGALEVVGEYRFRAFGKYNYAPLYNIYQYARMSDDDMKKLLEEYPKRKRVNCRIDL